MSCISKWIIVVGVLIAGMSVGCGHESAKAQLQEASSTGLDGRQFVNRFQTETWMFQGGKLRVALPLGAGPEQDYALNGNVITLNGFAYRLSRDGCTITSDEAQPRIVRALDCGDPRQHINLEGRTYVNDDGGAMNFASAEVQTATPFGPAGKVPYAADLAKVVVGGKATWALSTNECELISRPDASSAYRYPILFRWTACARLTPKVTLKDAVYAATDGETLSLKYGQVSGSLLGQAITWPYVATTTALVVWRDDGTELRLPLSPDRRTITGYDFSNGKSKLYSCDSCQ